MAIPTHSLSSSVVPPTTATSPLQQTEKKCAACAETIHFGSIVIDHEGASHSPIHFGCAGAWQKMQTNLTPPCPTCQSTIKHIKRITVVSEQIERIPKDSKEPEGNPMQQQSSLRKLGNLSLVAVRSAGIGLKKGIILPEPHHSAVQALWVFWSPKTQS